MSKQDSKEYTLSLGRSHKLRRKPYSESEEYDTDSSGERAELSSRADSSNQLSRQQVSTAGTGTRSIISVNISSFDAERVQSLIKGFVPFRRGLCH